MLEVKVLDVYQGSIILVLQCPSKESLNTIWKLHKENTLSVLMQEELVSGGGLKDHTLAVEAVEIEEEQYQRCKAELTRLGISLTNIKITHLILDRTRQTR